jgi:hypothetical protein
MNPAIRRVADTNTDFDSVAHQSTHINGSAHISPHISTEARMMRARATSWSGASRLNAATSSSAGSGSALAADADDVLSAEDRMTAALDLQLDRPAFAVPEAQADVMGSKP